MGVLLFFTFFSNTLQSLTLPKVTTVKPQTKSLEFTLEGSGKLTPLREAKLLNASGWKVRQVLVKEGEQVTKGQTLIRYDSQVAEAELKDEVAALDKQRSRSRRCRISSFRRMRKAMSFRFARHGARLKRARSIRSPRRGKLPD